MRQYRNPSKRPVEGIAPGEEGELELSAQAERDYVERGFLELLPAEYEVVGSKAVFGNAPGSTFSMALPAGQEQLLVDAGHLERVEAKPKPTRRKASDKE